MDDIKLFTDGSVNTKSKIGYGAYRLIPGNKLLSESVNSEVKVKRFEETNSTKLELQTLLWALREIDKFENKITVFTDSQNIISILERRERLEQNNFSSKKNELIKNHLLYKEFYKITDVIPCEFVKVDGHKKSNQKNDIDWLFALVDKAARKALRKENRMEKKQICQ